VLSIYFHREQFTWLPFSAEIRDHEGKRLAFFTKKGFKTTELSFFHHKEEKLGTYTQNDWKNLMTIKGTLFDAKGKELIHSKVKGRHGDFRLVDVHDQHFANFKYGITRVDFTKIGRLIPSFAHTLSKK
jgi:hypothetical protein